MKVGQFCIIARSADIGENVTIGNYCQIKDNAKIGDNVVIGDYCEIREGCIVGENTSFGSRCTLAAKTKIGKNCKIKYGFVATDSANFDGLKTPCIVGDNVRIGANVTLMPGRTVGDGATIGACSQVRQDVPDNQIWWGNPADPTPNGVIIEDGAQKVNGVFMQSEGGVIYAPDVHFQSFVSIKRGLRKGENTIIGSGTYVCSFANIGHNVQIGKECFIAVGAKILGNVVLGDHVYVGANAVVTQDRKVGSWVKIRAGEVVAKDIPSDTYYGLNGKMCPNKFSPSVKMSQ